MENYDVIIIGAGLGGLVSGAKLSKEGKKVLLIEQHSIPGGCATSFKRKGFTIEVGLHEMDGFSENDLKTKIFKDLGVFDHIELLKVPEFYRVVTNNVDIVIPDNTQEAIKILTDYFPEEEKGIKKYFKTIQAIRNEIYKLPNIRKKTALLLPIFPLLYPNITFNTFNTVGRFLDKITKNEDLKLVLAANIAYYHDDPYSMSLIYYSAAQAGFYSGGYFIKGGSQKLSDYLANIIKSNGGEILFKQLVTKIIIENGKAVGVEYKKNSSKEDDINRSVFSKIIIANAAIPNLVTMLPEKEQLFLNKKIKHLEKACSLLSIYICFKSDIKELGNKHYSTFVMDRSISKQSDIRENFKNDFSSRSFVFVDYGQIDSGLAPQGKGFAVVCAVDYLSNWSELEEEEYKNKKEAVAQIFFKQIEKLIPGIMEQIEYYEVGTPKTIQRYTLNPDGTPYGFAQTVNQAGLFRLSNKSPITNLYFASAWTNPGGGFTGAMLSGWFCANEIENKYGDSFFSSTV
jgi:phytoene dehydrogenase-like protein